MDSDHYENYPDTGGSFLEGGFGKDGGQRTAAMKCGAVRLKTAEGKWLEAGEKSGGSLIALTILLP
jgi:hypothetical protein